MMTDEERLRRVQAIVNRAPRDGITGHYALNNRQIDEMYRLLPEWMHDDFTKSLDRNAEWKRQCMNIEEMVDELREND